MISEKTRGIDEYIAAFPKDVQKILQQIRITVKRTAPGSEETIKYNMPAFMLNGNLVYFAAYKHHIGFYPAPSNEPAFKKDLAPYKTGRGSVQFPLNQPIPFDLITKIVKFYAKRNAEKIISKK